MAADLAAWWLHIVNIFMFWVYLPIPFLLLIGWVVPAWRRMTPLLLVPFIGWMIDYGAVLQPKSAPSAPVALRVMTWNIYYENHHGDLVAEAILAADPDVVALQEVAAQGADRLIDRLSPTYPYHSVFPSNAARGFAIFSRYPLSDIREPGLEPSECRCQRATVDLNGQPVTVFNVHFQTPIFEFTRLGQLPILVGFETERQDEARRALLQQIETLDTPIILLGDLNTTDRQANYRYLREYLHDAHKEVGFGVGHTWPKNPLIGPLIRIDYVMFSDEWQANTLINRRNLVSDHYSLVAELSWRSENPSASAQK